MEVSYVGPHTCFLKSSLCLCHLPGVGHREVFGDTEAPFPSINTLAWTSPLGYDSPPHSLPQSSTVSLLC